MTDGEALVLDIMGAALSIAGTGGGTSAVLAATKAPALANIGLKTGHYASRLEAAGLNVGRVESAVLSEVRAMQGNMATGASVSGRLSVDGVVVEYRTMMLESGKVNIGTIFPVR